MKNELNSAPDAYDIAAAYAAADAARDAAYAVAEENYGLAGLRAIVSYANDAAAYDAALAAREAAYAADIARADAAHEDAYAQADAKSAVA